MYVRLCLHGCECICVCRCMKVGKDWCHFSGIAYLFLLLFETRSLTGWNLQMAWPGQTKSPEGSSASPPAFLLLIPPVFGDCSLVVRADPYKDCYDIGHQDGKSLPLTAPIEY